MLFFFCFYILHIRSVCIPSYFNHFGSTQISTNGATRYDADELILGEGTSSISLKFTNLPEKITEAVVELQILDVTRMPQVFALIRGNMSSNADVQEHTNAKAGPIILESTIGASFETPDLTSIIKEVTSGENYAGEVHLIFAIISTPGSLKVRPTLRIESCQEEDCETLNFCCEAEFDGTYVIRDGGSQMWERDDNGYAIWLEDITAFDGVSVDEQRWVIGSMYSTESPILVSSRTDENAFPALQNEWVRFESMEALGSSKTGSLVDCALQWGDCSQCVGTRPPTTVSTTQFPSGSPTDNPSLEPTYTPISSTSISSSDDLHIEVALCEEELMDTSSSDFEVEVCASATCNVYTMGQEYSLFLPADDFIRKADTVRLVSGSDSPVCASMTIAQGETFVSVGPKYLDDTCDMQTDGDLCPCGSFSYQGYVTSCKQFSSGNMVQPVVADSRNFITSVPTGTTGFTLSVQCDITFELYAFAGMRDTYDKECILGKGCPVDPPRRNLFNIQGSYQGMQIFYSGIENRGWYSVIIPELTEDVTFVLDATQAGLMDIHVSYEQVSPCEDDQVQCEVCSASEWVCPEGQTAMCDGGALPTCVDDDQAPYTCIDCAETLVADIPSLPEVEQCMGISIGSACMGEKEFADCQDAVAECGAENVILLLSCPVVVTCPVSTTTSATESPECLGMTAFDPCMNGSAFSECEQAVAECGNEEHVLILESCPLQFQCQSQETST